MAGDIDMFDIGVARQIGIERVNQLLQVLVVVGHRVPVSNVGLDQVLGVVSQRPAIAFGRTIVIRPAKRDDERIITDRHQGR